MSKTPKRTPRTKDVLRYARNLLINKNWCKNQYAKDAKGMSLDAIDEKADSFCMVGAIQRATYDLRASGNVFHKCWNKLAENTGGSPSYYNDYSDSKESIIALFNKALK